MLRLKNGQSVTLEQIPDDHWFRLSVGYYSDTLHRSVITGWRYGVKLWHNQSRARVRIEADSREVKFKDRAFTISAPEEQTLPLTVDVEYVSDEAVDALLTGRAQPEPLAEDTRTSTTALGGATTMDTQQAKILVAYRAKFAHAQKALTTAKSDGDDAKVATAENRVNQIVTQAAEKGITEAELSATVTGAGQGPAKVTTIAKGKATEKVAPKPGPGPDLKQANKDRLAALAAKKAGKPAPKAKKEVKASATRDCLCGCGTETSGKFAPGHDARVKGWLMKVERGEMPASELPASIQPYVKYAGKAASAGKDTSDYRLVKSPVKVPGRPEIEVVEVE